LASEGRQVKYLFHCVDGHVDEDRIGQELNSIDDARREAVRIVTEVLRDNPDAIWKGGEFRVEVTDKNRLVLFTVMVVGVDSAAVLLASSNDGSASH
jgi:hypothetical protein